MFNEIAPRLNELAHKIGEESGEEGKKLANYLFDLSSELAPNRADFAYAAKAFRESAQVGDPEWQKVFPSLVVAVETVEVAEPVELEMSKLPTAISSDKESEEDDKSKLKRMQSLVKGLLVRELGANLYAGKASQMNATARAVSRSREMGVRFNQSVGRSMSSALSETIKYMRVRHGELPIGYDVEISFEEQYVPKDGPSAAVACGLLIEGLISDHEWNSDFAVTGDLNADGSVQPVGGIDGKIRGATRRDCEMIAIPIQNSELIRDLQMVDGPKFLIDIQVFSIETFDETVELAHVAENRSDQINEAIATFAEIQSVLQRPQGVRLLQNSHVIDRLRKVVTLAPNHLSARYLLQKALGREPRLLRLQGSLIAIDRAAAPLISAIRAGKFEPRSSSLDEDEYGRALSQLSRVRPKLSDSTKPIGDSLITYTRLMKSYVNDPPKSSDNQREAINEIISAANSVAQAYDSVENSIEYQESIGG